MAKFTQGEWVYWKDPEGTFTINSPDELIALTFGEAGAHDMEVDEANARAIAAVPEMYERLSDVLNTIRNILPLISDTVDTYDLQVEADLIDELLTRIDGEQEAQS